MKRISYAGGSIITGAAVAAALLEYSTGVAGDATNVSVDVPVLEENGTTTIHTILLGPSSQFDVSDVDGQTPDLDEAERFPVPALPSVVTTGSVATAVAPSAEREASARDFDDAVAHIEHALDDGSL